MASVKGAQVSQIELSAGKVKDAMRDAGASSSDLWKVPVDEIRVIPGFNVRQHDENYKAHVAGLCSSIVANGFRQDKPLAGYVGLEDKKSVIYLTDGHCRLAAVQMAIQQGCEIETLPVVVSPKGTNMEDLTVALVTSNNGKPLSPYETALVCKRLIGYGMEEAEIARRLSFTAPYVSGLLGLAGAPKRVRDLVVRGEVSATTAMEAVRKHGDEAAEKLEAGVAKAKASGKTKATGKHFDKPRAADYRDALQGLVDALEKVTLGSAEGAYTKAVELLMKGK